jgi:hypothetical protein
VKRLKDHFSRLKFNFLEVSSKESFIRGISALGTPEFNADKAAKVN